MLPTLFRSIDWTAVSVAVALLVFLVDSTSKRRARRANSRLVAAYLSWDLSRLAHSARELGMYLATRVEPYAGRSRADTYLTERASQLNLPTLERHADCLSELPPVLTEALAECLSAIQQLQHEVWLLTSDEPLGRHYPSVEEGKRRANNAAAAVMNDAEFALDCIRRARLVAAWSLQPE